MRDRDKLLIIIVLIAGVTLLPYFFYIKDTKESTNNIETEIVQLNERYEYLLTLEAHREEYETKIAEYNQDIIDIVKKYPTNITNDNHVMFLLNTEYAKSYEVVMEIPKALLNEDGEEGEDGDEIVLVEGNYIYPGLRIDTGSFGTNIETVLEDLDYTTEYSSLTMETQFSFICRKYEDCLFLLDYLNNYKDPMAYKSITFDFNEDTGNVEGVCVLTEYAVIGGEGRDEFKKLPIEPEVERGNEEYGVFGPTEAVKTENEYIQQTNVSEETEE